MPHRLLITFALVALAGCASSTPATSDATGTLAPAPPAPPAFVQGVDAGAPSISMGPVHGCTKIRTATLGAILRSLGVAMDAAVPGSAAQLYASGADALGTARYAERTREPLHGSTAGAEKRDDLFVLAAVEIHRMAKSGAWNAPACPGTALFDASHALTLDGASCLIGKPARADHVALGHELVSDVLAAADPSESPADARDRGERIVIATLLSAAHGCE